MQTQTLIQDLARHILRPVDEESRVRAGLHLMDWAGCAVAGSCEPAGKILLAEASQRPESRAFAWGGIGNILEMDDVDKRAILHPGPAIIPAALALSGKYSREDLLTAVVRGYEATIRLGRAVGAGHYALWHSTGTCGAIGAAAACASLLNLDDMKMAHALSLAVSQSAGLWQTRHEATSMGKQLHTAAAARDGLTAAKLAGAGFTGPLSILEGEQGFFAAMCPGASAQDIMSDYDADWLIHQVSFKPWPACRHAHAAIDAALLAREAITVDEVERVMVSTYGDALKFCDRPNPASVIEAKFSLQHSVAATFVDGAPEMSAFEIPVIDRADIAALRERISVEISDTYEAVYPARFGAEVAVSVGDDTQTFVAADALGDPENPVTPDLIRAKTQKLMAHAGLVAAQSETLISSLLASDARNQTLLDTLEEALR